MQYRLLDSLGLTEARKCNADFGSVLPLEPEKLAKGQLVELPKPAADWLSKTYPALLEPAGKLKGEAKQSDITAPLK